MENRTEVELEELNTEAERTCADKIELVEIVSSATIAIINNIK